MAPKHRVHIVAGVSTFRAEMSRAVFALGHHAEVYSDYHELLVARPRQGVILAEDIAELGGVCGLIGGMSSAGFWLPIIATSSAIEIPRVVAGVRCGAFDYLGTISEPEVLQEALDRAISHGDVNGQAQAEAFEARVKLDELTAREIEVLDLLVAGLSSKAIARELQISPRTVEIHRANIMSKLDARNVADVVRWRLTTRPLTGQSLRA